MTYGFAGYLGLAKETTWGTPVAAASYFEALSESLVSTLARFQIKNIVGGAMYEPDDETGLYTHEGNIVAAAHPQVVGHFLRGCFGIQSTSVVLSGFLFKHDYYPILADAGSANALPPYTLEIFRDVTSSEQFAGVNFGSIDFEAAPNQDLRMTVKAIAKSKLFIARSVPVGSIASFPTSPTGVFKFDTASISVAGAADDSYASFKVSYDNQIQGVATLNGSTSISRIRRSGPQLVRISGSIEFTDITDALNFENQTEQRFTLSFTKANSFSLVFDMPRVVFSTFPRQMSGRDRIMVPFEGIGRFHTGSQNAIKVSLTTVNTF